MKAIVTDPIRPQNLHALLKQRFEHLVVSFHRPVAGAVPRFVDPMLTTDPMEVVIAFLSEAQGIDASPEQVHAARTQFEDLQREGVSA